MPACDRVAVDEPVHETDAIRLFGFDRAPGQDHVQRARLADHARQPLRAAVTGDEAELDLGQAHFRVARGDAERARERKLEAAAERVAVDDGDRRHRQAVELREGRLAELRPALLLGERAARSAP